MKLNVSDAEEMVKQALKKGCDAAEVYLKSSKSISSEAKEGKVEAVEASNDFGIALRVLKNNRLGFAYATEADEIQHIIDKAAEAASWTSADEFHDIPEFSPAGELQIFDSEINNVKDEHIINDAIMLEKSALSFDKRMKRVRKAEVAAGTGRTVIVNSNGVKADYESTFYSASVTALAMDEKNDSQMGWEYAGSRKMGKVDIKAVGEGAARRAVELLGSRKINSLKAPVIISNSVAVDFLEILSASLSAEAVQKKRSFLSGKVGKEVISPILDIVNDGTMPWMAGSRPVDDEGVPAMQKIFISKGVLKGYMHNTYTARKDSTVSTGNAVRGSFKALPGVGVTNLYLKTGESQKTGVSRQESVVRLIKSLSKGILITGAMGVHTANPVSGDFSVGISGLMIENGETVYPVKEAVISGNILEVFKKVEAAGDDLKFYGGTGSPSLLIGDMDISA